MSRIVIKGLRAIQTLDVPITGAATVIIGENNSGKSTFLHGIRLRLDVTLSSAFCALSKEDVDCAVDETRAFRVLVAMSLFGGPNPAVEIAAVD